MILHFLKFLYSYAQQAWYLFLNHSQKFRIVINVSVYSPQKIFIYFLGLFKISPYFNFEFGKIWFFNCHPRPKGDNKILQEVRITVLYTVLFVFRQRCTGAMLFRRSDSRLESLLREYLIILAVQIGLNIPDLFKEEIAVQIKGIAHRNINYIYRYWYLFEIKNYNQSFPIHYEYSFEIKSINIIKQKQIKY